MLHCTHAWRTFLSPSVAGRQVAPPSTLTSTERMLPWADQERPVSTCSPAGRVITSELHKGFSPLFVPSTPEDYKPLVRERLLSRLAYVDESLGKAKKPYLLGDTFSVADAYLFTVANWAGFVGLDIKGLTKLGEYQGRVRERPAVAAALRAEGLTK